MPCELNQDHDPDNYCEHCETCFDCLDEEAAEMVKKYKSVLNKIIAAHHQSTMENAMIERRITLRDLSNKTGIKASRLSDLKTHRAEPTSVEVDKIAMILGDKIKFAGNGVSIDTTTCPACGQTLLFRVFSRKMQNRWLSGLDVVSLEEKDNVLQPDSKISDLVKVALHELIKNDFNALEFDIQGVSPDGPFVMHFEVTMRQAAHS